MGVPHRGLPRQANIRAEVVVQDTCALPPVGVGDLAAAAGGAVGTWQEASRRLEGCGQSSRQRVVAVLVGKTLHHHPGHHQLEAVEGGNILIAPVANSFGAWG